METVLAEPPKRIRPGRRPSTSRNRPNALRDWLMQHPKPMSMVRFAELIGVTPSYVSQLTSDVPPWPGRDISLRIGIVTEGAVTPNELAGYPPPD